MSSSDAKFNVLIFSCITFAFILGLVSGVVMHDFAVTNSSIAAKCKSIGGIYGGGKCYDKGVEVTN